MAAQKTPKFTVGAVQGQSIVPNARGQETLPKIRAELALEPEVVVFRRLRPSPSFCASSVYTVCGR
jgi:hypothetical protein